MERCLKVRNHRGRLQSLGGKPCQRSLERRHFERVVFGERGCVTVLRSGLRACELPEGRAGVSQLGL